MARARNLMVAAGLVAFAAAGMSFPFYMASSRKPVIDPTKPLPPQATFRGPYINTGSRDVGPDFGELTEKTCNLLSSILFCLTDVLSST
ncbi:uncharacterized protein HKW66_Vig0142520 [Vigna angularis]|uniref:Uncharacterized protein n=1 Tax=Phaseolus angularis TaxID=3914 RepID=A0A8T0KF23_PHAAN|nr:uncharacterized protein HKW66_Vig0142520 [Vigna angularis]